MTSPKTIIKLYLALAIFAGVLYQTKAIFNYEDLHNSKLEHKRGNRNTSDKPHSRKLSICVFEKWRRPNNGGLL